jgi:hypothetical protein
MTKQMCRSELRQSRGPCQRPKRVLELDVDADVDVVAMSVVVVVAVALAVVNVGVGGMGVAQRAGASRNTTRPVWAWWCPR